MKSFNLASSLLNFIVVLIFAGFGIQCESDPYRQNPLLKALSSDDPRIQRVMDNIDAHQVQIRFTRIDRTNDSIVFKDFDFQVDSDQYFYPASTVKFPIAVMALEKLNEIDDISLTSQFYVEGDSIETTFGNEIVKIFAVSDNEANNRLFEFLGQDKINSEFVLKNIGPARISHRLSAPDADNVTTKALVVYLNDSTTMNLENTINAPIEPLRLKNINQGIGFYAADSLMMRPFDFSLKNYYPIATQHEVLKRIIFPDIYPGEERFQLSESQHKFLLDAMKVLPKDAGYNPEEYYDSYGKFFMYGGSKDPIPEHIKIYNKVGYAYGTLTDCAYIIDEKNEVEFMITATILVNADGIFNDNVYEYDTLGIPFLDALGDELYQIELKQRN